MNLSLILKRNNTPVNDDFWHKFLFSEPSLRRAQDMNNLRNSTMEGLKLGDMKRIVHLAL